MYAGVRQLSRVAVVALIGGLVSACSSDTFRFADSPFSNPFAANEERGEPRMTGSIAPAPRMAVQSQPLPAPRQAAAPAYSPYTPPKPTAAPAPSQPMVSTGPGGWTAQGGTVVTIGEGENLNIIANRYAVPSSAILSANGLRNASQVGPGRQVIIPVYNAVGAQDVLAQRSPAQPRGRLDTANFAAARQPEFARQPGRPGEPPARNERMRAQPLPEPQRLARAEVQPIPQPKLPAQGPAKQEPTPTAKEPDQTASLPGSNGAEFRWPARGRIISAFGSAGNEGINIAVPEGTPVKAAEAGTVAYAGSEVKGYGNLVLIRHDNGLVSAYAHNGEITVKRGDRVKRGQVVAKSGQSGNVTSPQLHFEIRKGSTPVDPVPFFD
jgi:murein DD-endopeptidase MepM/ murein hydrolase activator NlpD